jgi:hypothetical protein
MAWAAPDWGGRPADTVLGREGGAARLLWPPVRVDVPSGGCHIRHYWGRFFAQPQAVSRPCRQLPVDTASLQSFATVPAAAACAASAVQSQPSPESTGRCGGDAATCAASAGQLPPSPGSTGRCGGDVVACAASAGQLPPSPV